MNAKIHTQAFEHAVRLPLEWIQTDNSVYIFDDGKLKKQTIGIARREAHHAVINRGLNDGDLLVTTQLPIMYDAMPVTMAKQKTPRRRSRHSESRVPIPRGILAQGGRFHGEHGEISWTLPL